MKLTKSKLREIIREELQKLDEGGGAEGMIGRIIKDIEKYKIKYLKQAVRQGDWHSIQELGYSLEDYGKQLVKWGIKAGK